MFFVFFIISLIFLSSIHIYALPKEGVFSRKIVIATHQPLSGPANEYSDIGKSSLAYFKFVNDQGGIHGREIELIMFDDQLKPEITLKYFLPLYFKKEIFSFFSGIGNKTNQTVYPFLKKHRIPRSRILGPLRFQDLGS